MNNQVDLVPLFRRQLELCQVGENDLVALLADANTRPAYRTAAAAALATLGAPVFEVSVPSMGGHALTFNKGMGSGVPALQDASKLRDAVLAALSHATLVLDLVSETIIHLPLRQDLKAAGCRILTIVEPPDVLERMFPTPDIRRFVEQVGAKVAGGNTLRVSSAAGTDLIYKLDGSTPVVQYGYTDTPGRWDHWPSAMATAYPIDGSANGTVVLQPGDVIFPFKRYVQTEVRIEAADGYINQISGGADARLIDEYLVSWNEPEVFAVSHIGIGLHPRARWGALDFYEKSSIMGMDARSFMGGFIFSTGPNHHIGRIVDAHLDMPMRDCTIEIDGQVVALNEAAILDAAQLAG